MKILQKFFEDMKSKDFDSIRLATYRTGCKLRYLTERTTLFKVDIYNVIEIFRSSGLIGIDSDQVLSPQQINSVIRNLLWTLNKRLPLRNSSNFENTVALTHSLLSSICLRNDNIHVSSLKITLAILCCGKLVDRLRYIYSLISDNNGLLLKDEFENFLKDALALPTAVGEGLTFSYDSDLLEECLADKRLGHGANVNSFVRWISEPDPSSRLIWLSILYKMDQTEMVHHMIKCKTCEKRNFTGFRYKCLRCYNYQQCQDCYWKGRISGQHDTDHDVKEFTAWLGRGKSMVRSFRRSFRWISNKNKSNIPIFPDQPTNKLDLHGIVPSPPPIEIDETYGTENSIDEEHALIARYASRLARHSENAPCTPYEVTLNIKETMEKEKIINEMEQKNRKLLQELRNMEENSCNSTLDRASLSPSPVTITDLEELHQNKAGLENQISTVLSYRLQLLQDLEETMNELKALEAKDEMTNGETPKRLKRKKSRLERARRSIAVILSQSFDVLNDESLYESDIYNELYIPLALDMNEEDLIREESRVDEESYQQSDERIDHSADDMESLNINDNDLIVQSNLSDKSDGDTLNGHSLVTAYRAPNPLDLDDLDDDFVVSYCGSPVKLRPGRAIFN